MFTLIVGGLATLATLIVLVLGFSILSVGSLFLGGALSLLLAGRAVAPMVDDPY